MQSMQQTSIRRFGATALLVAIILVASACGSTDTSAAPTPSTTMPDTAGQGTAPDEAGDTSTSGAASSPATTATTPPGDPSVALEWQEAGLSGETFIDELFVTDTLFVAYRVAHGSQAWVSEDGVDWTPNSLVFEGTTDDDLEPYSVTVGGPGYVALGGTLDDSSAMWTSQDGFAWTRHELDLEFPELGVFESIGVGPVVGGPSGLVLTGTMDREGPDEHRFFVWTSADGSEWNLVPDAFPDGAYIGEILPTATGFITKGFVDGPEGGGGIWTSTDGASWDEVDIDSFDADLYGLTHLDLEVWNDKILAVGETEQGFIIWESSDGDTWEQLPASPLLEHTDQLRVSLDQISAGPYGIVLTGELAPGARSRAEPPIVMEKDNVILTLELGSDEGRLTVTDRSTGSTLVDVDVISVLEGEVDEVAFSDDGSITVTHPETGEQTTFTEDDFEEAWVKANEAAGIEPGSEREQVTIPMLWFSPDGQRWTSVDLEETFEVDSLPDPDNGVVVGTNSVILRWRDYPQDEEGSEEGFEDEEDFHEDPPDVIWIGTLTDGS